MSTTTTAVRLSPASTDLALAIPRTTVGALGRSRRLEAVGLLGIMLQGRLGTESGTAWKLVLPAHG